jgi:regulatory protein
MFRRRAKVDEHRAADPAAVRSAAVAMLARREYASSGLAGALQRKGYVAAIVAEVVAEMVGERLVDDERYAEGLVRSLGVRGKGPRHIRQELAEAGLATSLVDTAMAGGADWHQLAAEVRQRKFGTTLPKSWPERARQMRFLQYRGFSKDHIASALGGSGANDPGTAELSPDDS